MTDNKNLTEEALEYHALPKPGKLSVQTSKPLDLRLAYTPGVGEPVKAIAKDKKLAYRYTNKGNLVAVISNGSAILGLGNLGALASKPVMEGKAVLFKAFADIDVYDIEIDSADPQAIIDTISNIAPTFGGINLEDIKAPECFIIEKALQKKLDIPVFHDDQHGTAIVLAAGLLNAMEIQQKKPENAKIVCIGCGAAGLASMELLTHFGIPKENITCVDSKGPLHLQRQDLSVYKSVWQNATAAETLEGALENADILIGLSGPNIVSEAHVRLMADKPIIFALSNPDPEIHPDIVKNCSPNALMATGRSDFPNQINNVLCFPYIFRGALDAQAKHISLAMKLAAVEAIRNISKDSHIPDSLRKKYPHQNWNFGTDYCIPLADDPRLREQVSQAVFLAAKNESSTA